MEDRPDADVEAWYAALEARHLATLTFPEVRRALQALSAVYVERRDRLSRGAALDGAGKRAAFALYYGPLHFMVVREIVRALGAADSPPHRIVDLGCGTGVAGAAWALAAQPRPTVTAIDANGWAIDEAAWNLRTLGVPGTAKRADLDTARLGAPGEAIVAAYVVNELDEAPRERLLSRLLAAHVSGSRVLVVEPIARGTAPFFTAWADAFSAAGGRAEEWRFPSRMPERMKLLGRTAGLDHRELTARSLWLPERGR